MIRLVPDSSSEILRATHIGLITLVSVSASEWREAGRILVRDVNLIVALTELFKGDVRQGTPAVLPLQAKQCQPAGSRIFAVPGAWSGYDLEPGARFVLFSLSPSQDAVEVFSEPSLFMVQPAATAVPDIRLVLLAGLPELSLAALVPACRQEIAAWGFLFSRYLEARMPEAFFRRISDFDALLAAVEDPHLPAIPARILLSAAYTKLMLYDPAPVEFLHHLLATTQRVLQTPRGEPLREAVLRTYLPNLLGLTGGLPPKSAIAVLGSDRTQFFHFLASVHADPAVLAWVRS